MDNIKIYGRRPFTSQARPEMVLLAPAVGEETGVNKANQVQDSQTISMSNQQPVETSPAEIDPEAVADLVLEMLEADLKTDYERRGGGFNRP